MSFVAPVMDIGSGLANGIMSGTNSLNSAIDFVRNQYTQQKQAQGAMTALQSMKDPSGNPLISADFMDQFQKLSPQAQSAAAGIMSQRAQGVWQTQNQQLLQRSQGNVETGVHAANTATDYGIAAQHGVIPNRQPDQYPAGIGNRTQAPQNNGGSNLVPNQPQQPNQPSQPQRAPGLPSHVPMAPQVPTKTLNGQSYAVQHQNPNDPNSPITHVFDPGSGKWIGVGSGQ